MGLDQISTAGNLSSMQTVTINLGQSMTQFTPKEGTVTLIVGPNGVGKSALLQDIYRQLQVGIASYYPGHRQITFSHGWENIQMPLHDLERNLFGNTEAFNRYKNHWPEEQFKSVLRRLQNAETAYQRKRFEAFRLDSSRQDLLEEKSSPLDILNIVFSTARMTVQFLITDEGLTARRGDYQYSIDRLSDGERAALFLTAAVASRSDGGIVIVDEPERHLHPSISAPLVSAIVRSKSDIAFIFATHDLTLIETLDVDHFIYVRDSSIIHQNPERRNYDIRQGSALDQISPDLKRDILGVRDRVLFVEGKAESLDVAIYSIFYPGWKVSPRGGHEKVQEAVKALNDNSDLHWITVMGIVDGDGRDSNEIASLRASKIFTLQFPSIENLFFLPNVVKAIAHWVTDSEGGNVDSLLASANAAVSESLKRDFDNIVLRRAMWIVNRKISGTKISVNDLRNGLSEIGSIDIDVVKTRVEGELAGFLQGGASLESMSTLPIKNTGLPACISATLGLSSKKYKQIVIHQIETNTKYGSAIRDSISSSIPALV